MFIFKKALPLLLLVLLVFALPQGVIAQPAGAKMTFEDYQIELQRVKDLEAAAKTEIDQINGRIAGLNSELMDLNNQISSVWSDVYAAAGTTKDKVDGFILTVEKLEASGDDFSRMSSAELFEQIEDLNGLILQVSQAQSNPEACVMEPRERLNRLNIRLERLKAKAAPPAKPKEDIYDVVRGDHLWKIAGRQDILGNSMQWPRIWSANRTDISNPDMIYPAQRLRIPRGIGRDQHLVARGDHLSKIAGLSEVYGDPFQWRKIYQANKNGQHLQDPNLIYPEQILDIPRN